MSWSITSLLIFRRSFFYFTESGCFMTGKKIGGFNMHLFFPKEFEQPNAPFGQIVKNEYVCRDLCHAKAPKCGGFTYFARGLRRKGKCLLKAHPEWINKRGPYKFLSNSNAISGTLSCPGIMKGMHNHTCFLKLYTKYFL